MIKKLNLRNFRAFKAQPLTFGKINIFVGPNNSGKSSAISAINLIAQTVGGTELDENPLALNGPFDNLGTYLDVVHGNRSNTPMGIDIAFDQYEVKLEYKYRQQRREIELVKFELLDGRKQALCYTTKKDSFSLRLSGTEIEQLLPNVRKRRPSFRNLMPIARFGLPFQMSRDESLPKELQEKLFRVERTLSRARMHLEGVV